MSDTIVVMNEGNIQQIGSPKDIYNEPKNAFVADFIGESNIIDGIMHEDGVVGCTAKKLPLSGRGGLPPTSRWMWSSGPRISISSPWEEGQLTGTVTEVTFRGCTTTSSWTSGLQVAHSDHRLLPCGGQNRGEDRPDGFHIMKKSRIPASSATTAPTATSTMSSMRAARWTR